jgi:phosphoglycolate phosphatase-like HAD superfamily hydrolase
VLLRSFEGIIFDFDGTLVDTLTLSYHAFSEAIAEVTGRQYSREEIESFYGPNEEGILQAAVPESWQECLACFLRVYEARHDACVRPFQGIQELLASAKGWGLRLGIVTSKGLQSLNISLDAFELRGFFEDLRHGSAEGPQKPQHIESTVRRWGIPAQAVVYVGDSPYDMKASREAGTIPVGAAWSDASLAETLRQAGAQRVFVSVVEFCRWLESRVGSSVD